VAPPSPTTACFRAALRECPPCYFKLVATRPTTQLKPTPRTRWAGRRQVNGSHRLFRRTAGLGLRAFRGSISAMQSLGSRQSEPPTRCMSPHSRHSSISRLPITPQILQIILWHRRSSPPHSRVRAQGNYPGSCLPRAWGNFREISMDAQIISDDDQIPG